jgi:DNA-binding XRE family transcriptional regulator
MRSSLGMRWLSGGRVGVDFSSLPALEGLEQYAPHQASYAVQTRADYATQNLGCAAAALENAFLRGSLGQTRTAARALTNIWTRLLEELSASAWMDRGAWITAPDEMCEAACILDEGNYNSLGLTANQCGTLSVLGPIYRLLTPADSVVCEVPGGGPAWIVRDDGSGHALLIGPFDHAEMARAYPESPKCSRPVPTIAIPILAAAVGLGWPETVSTYDVLGRNGLSYRHPGAYNRELSALERARIALGLSRQAVADAIGRNAMTIYHLETGRTRPSVKTRRALGAVLGIPEPEIAAMFRQGEARHE